MAFEASPARGRVLRGLLASMTLAAACLPDLSAAAASRPNVVLIVVDDLGYGELGCYGGTDIPTPQIDELAAQGARFTSAYVTAPFCAPSRAGLFTGRYQTRFGFEFNPVGAANADPAVGLPPAERTLANVLRDAGYATSLLGKWHLGATAAYHPMRRGYDEFYGFLHEGHSYVPRPWQGVTTWLRRKTLPDGGMGRWTSPDARLIFTTHLGSNEPDYDADNPILRAGQPVDEPEHLTDALAREAIDFIERHRSQPFFLTLAYNAVHSPMQGDDAYVQRFSHIDDVHRRVFAAMLAHLDDSVGKILAKLAAVRLDQNTVVVLLSDNGGPTRELTSRNDPLRGGKGQFYEGGIRVPLIIRWPARLPAGQVVKEPVISLDVAATLLAAARLEDIAQFGKLDGMDLLPALTNETSLPTDRPLYWRMGDKAALRQGDWKLVRNQGSEWELYQLSVDMAEQTNLAAENQDRVQQLQAAWETFDRQMARPLWKPAASGPRNR